MEYLDTSRSARKYEPGRTSRYRRVDPRSSNIILGYDKDHWATTNGDIQQQVVYGSNNQGRAVTGDRKMTSSRKRGMLESTLSLGNSCNDWHTESKHNYHTHDLRTWGPRALIQKDSYSWTEDHRRQLAQLRDASNSQVTPAMSAYVKLPPIYAKANNGSNGQYDSNQQMYNGGGQQPKYNSSNGQVQQLNNSFPPQNQNQMGNGFQHQQMSTMENGGLPELGKSRRASRRRRPPPSDEDDI